MSSPCMCQAFICTYSALDFSNISWVCKGKGEVLCCVQEQCLDFSEPSLGLGLVTNPDNQEFCKVAVPCLALGLKNPEYCIRSASRILCIKEASSLPFDKDYVEGPVCAMYGIQCAPECSCCGPAGTHSPAIDRPMCSYPPSTSTMARVEMVSEEFSDKPTYRDEE